MCVEMASYGIKIQHISPCIFFTSQRIVHKHTHCFSSRNDSIKEETGIERQPCTHYIEFEHRFSWPQNVAAFFIFIRSTASQAGTVLFSSSPKNRQGDRGCIQLHDCNRIFYLFIFVLVVFREYTHAYTKTGGKIEIKLPYNPIINSLNERD